MAEKITFEESLGVEPEEFTLPLIRGCDDALVVYIPDKSSNIIMEVEQLTKHYTIITFGKIHQKMMISMLIMLMQIIQILTTSMLEDTLKLMEL